MSTNAVGILIIAAIILVGLTTGGDIFRSGSVTFSPNGSAVNQGSYSPSYTYPGIQNQLAPNSPYAKKVSIGAVNDPGTFNEFVELAVFADEGESINITGWKVRSTVTGQQITIGGAANIPHVGVRDQSPIVISSSGEVVLTAGRSPIGTSFRINKCLGYLEESAGFVPGISSYNCPAIIEDTPALSSSINDKCLDYIETLPRCKVPKERNFPDNINRACENFLKNEVGYGSCVAKHAGDANFLKDEWRVYAGTGGIHWREKRDNLELLDNAGRLVDVYSY